jgi:Mg-chelatase subunit ChlD
MGFVSDLNHHRAFIYFPRSSAGNSDGDDNNSGSKERYQQGNANNSHLQTSQSDNKTNKGNSSKDLLKYFLPNILRALGNQAIKESTPSLQELEQYLQNQLKEAIEKEEQSLSRRDKNDFSHHAIASSSSSKDKETKGFDNSDSQYNNARFSSSSSSSNPYYSTARLPAAISTSSFINSNDSLPIVTQLIQRGYLVDSNKWLKKRGFLRIGNEILTDIIKSLKKDKLGMHETKSIGNGDTVLENSKRYELGNEITNININSTVANYAERVSKKKQAERRIEFPLDINYEDLEVHETLEDIRVATAYCIDLSSTMRYSSMYNNMSRIEAAKRALWSLYILNKKFFPMDSIYLLGFGSVASMVDTFDIPFLKKFETNADFLHYTNYQAAYRLAKRILKKDVAKNKRIVMITDGHPSACFIDNSSERDRILRQRPYSHFYIPDQNKLSRQYAQKNNTKLYINDSQVVYLCYRYRQIDQYIGEQTIKEAKKTFKEGIKIDTIMVSEEDILLDYINELSKAVNGKSIYINPNEIDRVLVTDYLLNKKKTLRE